MSKPKNISSWLTKSLLVFIFLIVTVMVFAPSLINLEMVKKNIKEIISQNVGGRITYRNLKLSYFPSPHVVIHKAEISIPDSFTINIQWVKIYPKILPLFRGRLEIAVIRLDYADYAMKLPQIKNVPVGQPEHISYFDDMIKSLTSGVRIFPGFKLPDLNLKIKNGRVNLVDPFGRIFKLRNVQATYVRSQDKLEFNIKCQSNLWEHIDIKGLLDPSSFKGLVHVLLSRFRPQSLIAYLFPESALQVAETRANVTIDVTFNGSDSIKADVKGALPILELIFGEEKLAIKNAQISGTLEIDEEVTRITLTNLGLDYPKLNLAGIFVYDENLPDIQLSLKGSDIDAGSVRQAAIKLAGKSEVTRMIFDVIKGGHVTWMTVGVRGQTMADLGNLNNMTIQGQMTRGQIYIPGAKLDLEDVFGDALIAEGILHGEKLTARFRNSHGQDGTLILGLNEDLEPFHLNIGVQADLSQVPPVLNRIISHQYFQGELARVTDIKGTATGSLRLGNNLATLRAAVEVSKAQLTARYNRLPYPIKVDGGHFVYSGKRIALQNFNAEIGKSSFRQLATTIDWTKVPRLEAQSQKTKFDVGQLYSWLRSFETLNINLANIRSLNGDIATQNLIIKGPLFSPLKWHVKSSGMIDNLQLTSPMLPQKLLLKQGKFSWLRSQIDFADIDAAMGKSSVANISGTLNWKNKLLVSAQSGISTFYPEDISPLVFANKFLSKSLNRFQPLAGKMAFKRITYRGPISGVPLQPTIFSADIKQVKLNSKRLPGPIEIKKGQFSWNHNRISIQDIDAAIGGSQISGFSAGFDLKPMITFILHCKAANLLAGEIYPFLASLEKLQPGIRDFSATDGTLMLTDVNLTGPMHTPLNWHYDLTADMQNIAVNSPVLGDSLTINSGSIGITTEDTDKRIRKKVDAKAIKLNWGDHHLALFGAASFSKHGILLKMNLNSDGLVWDRIHMILEYIAAKKKLMDPHEGSDNLLGTVQVKTDKFIWNSYPVHSVEAEITFKPEKVVFAVNKADVCGITFRGLMDLSDQSLDLYLIPNTENHSLVSTLSCLTRTEDLATGTYSLSGEIRSRGKPETITQTLRGKLAFFAEKGRIYRFGLLAKLLSILNVTEIYRGEVPDLIGEGFAYHSMSASAKLQGSKIIIEECSIDGASMGIACEGNIDLVKKKMNLIILIAPFKTVDRIVEILPLIGSVMGGKLISIPFRAKGNLSDPTVYALPPTAVGSGILGILERTLRLPITIIQPVIYGIKNGKTNPSNIPQDSPH